MKVLGIETSCDETAAAVVVDGHQVLSSVVSSQVAQHAAYGGVIPELAAREHLRAVRFIGDEALAQAGLTAAEVDGLAVTSSPGLLPALLIGISYAKGLAAACARPLIGINHVEAHLFAAFLDQPERLRDVTSYPLLALVVSGGHTTLLEVAADGTFHRLGRTLDDAAGEAFDKAAKMLRLGYPGGPLIDQLATRGDPTRFTFPRGLTGMPGTPVSPEHRYDFSFSGVKTALLYHLRDRAMAAGKLPATGPIGDPADADLGGALDDQEFLDTIASFQEAVVDALVCKVRWAATERGARTLVLGGGVACNRRLRAKLQDAATALGRPLLITPPKYCTDNAAMVAGLGYYYLSRGLTSGFELDASPRFVAADHLPFTPG